MRDGVGDQTRLLAEQCATYGHRCCIVSVNDRQASQVVTSPGNVSTLRLPSKMPWPERVARARTFIDEFAPDWVSFQFVCYGFHDKGLVFALGSHIEEMRGRRKLHIMFHEVWIGEINPASPKEMMIGWLQRQSITQLFSRLKADVIHTSNQTYAAYLNHIGIRAGILSLFGNIPITHNYDAEWIFEELRASQIEITMENRPQHLLVGFFGALQPGWPPEPLISRLIDAAKRSGRRLVLLSMGSIGGGESLWSSLILQHSSQISFHKFGLRASEEVSQYLRFIDLGICTTDAARIGKSSSVAAMIDHGLPVVVNQSSESFRHFTVVPVLDDPLLFTLARFEETIDGGIPRAPARPRLPAIATKFLDDLKNSERVSQLCDH